MPAGMGMYTGGIIRGMYNSDPMDDGILRHDRAISSRSTGKVNPGNRGHNDTINITRIETGLQVRGLPETGQEAAREGGAGEGKLDRKPITRRITTDR